MRKKQPVAFAQKFPNADPLALRLLERLLAFDPKDRPTAEEVCLCFSLMDPLLQSIYLWAVCGCDSLHDIGKSYL